MTLNGPSLSTLKSKAPAMYYVVMTDISLILIEILFLQGVNFLGTLSQKEASSNYYYCFYGLFCQLCCVVGFCLSFTSTMAPYYAEIGSKQISLRIIFALRLYFLTLFCFLIVLLMIGCLCSLIGKCCQRTFGSREDDFQRQF